MRHGRLVACALAGVVALARGVAAGDGAAAGGRAAAPAALVDAFFATGTIPTLTLEVTPADVQALRDAPRTYVPCRLREEGGATLEDVAVKLKGGAGSFRAVDDRPALTLRTGRRGGAARFHGLEKFHLNNSVQDETRVCEALAAQLFAAAGVAAPRVTHARVRWNDRDLGLYVLKEGVDRAFLARHFARSDGNLYDGGFCQDVDADLEKDGGEGPDDRRDLRALVAACREPDLVVRERRLPAVVDVEALVTFVALERMVGHWDGYAQNVNNYRLYLRPPDGGAVFLPHGMDQVFQDPEASILDAPVGLVADAVLAVPAWRARFRGRLKELLPLFDAERSLLPRANAIVARLRPVVVAMGAASADAFEASVVDLLGRLAARGRDLAEQVTRPDPPGVEFDRKGRASVVGFAARVDEGEVACEQVDRTGRRAYALVAGKDGGGVASWRRRVVLGRGRYTFEAQVTVQGVQPGLGERAGGAILRISGADLRAGVSGAAPWRSVAFDFEVTETLRAVELVAELRAAKGSAFYQVDGFRLVRRAP